VVIQGQFNPNEPAGRLHEFLRSTLITQDPSASFSLVLPPTLKITADSAQPLRSLGLVPAGTVYVRTATGPLSIASIKPEILTRKTAFVNDPLPKPINVDDEKQGAAAAAAPDSSKRGPPAGTTPEDMDAEIEKRMSRFFGGGGGGGGGGGSSAKSAKSSSATPVPAAAGSAAAAKGSGAPGGGRVGGNSGTGATSLSSILRGVGAAKAQAASTGAAGGSGATPLPKPSGAGSSINAVETMTVPSTGVADGSGIILCITIPCLA